MKKKERLSVLHFKLKKKCKFHYIIELTCQKYLPFFACFRGGIIFNRLFIIQTSNCHIFLHTAITLYTAYYSILFKCMCITVCVQTTRCLCKCGFAYVQVLLCMHPWDLRACMCAYLLL